MTERTLAMAAPPATPNPDLPAVSVIVPARDAEATLGAALDSVLTQDYAGPVEVVVADGSEGSATAALLHRRYPSVRLVPNPARSTPAGLNLALRATRHEVVARCDAHSVLPPGYLSRAVETLWRTGAVNVGGRQVPVGRTRFERAAALAMTCWLGSGAAVRHRTVAEIVAARPEVADYTSFAFLRHPAERALSFWSDKHRLALSRRAARRRFIRPWHGLRPGMDFDELCRWLETPCGSDAFADRHWLSQHLQVRTARGRRPDVLGRVERLDDDWRALCGRLGMPHRPLPTLNRSARETGAAGLLDDRARDRLARRYAADFLLGGYPAERHAAAGLARGGTGT